MPAGHTEPGETIEAACKREVLEETGFECTVDHLISMECRGSGWYRLAFACSITGGKLKTQPDRESLKAGWHRIDALTGGQKADIQLRCRDFLPIIEEAVRYNSWKRMPKRLEYMAEPILNVNEQQAGLFIEFVIIYQSPLSKKRDRMPCARRH